MNRAALQLGKSPPLLMGTGLLVWGWFCHLLPWAVVMALLIESVHIVAWRWAITDKEFNTLSDLSGVMFFITVIYIFSNEGARGIFVILSVLPFVLFPLVITQQYSQHGSMKLSALLVSLRKLEPALSPEPELKTNISLPYFFICLVSASAGNQRTVVFFISVSLLIAIMLWSVRPRGSSSTVWLAMLLVSFSLAYAGQIGLRRLQASIEASFLEIFDQFMWRYRDPNRATTAIGSLGRLKLSDSIILRLKTPEKLRKPLLLREASYNSFAHGIWSNEDADFRVIDQNTDGSWTLSKAIQSNNELTLSTYMTREKGVIPLPHGSSKIKNIAAIEIQRNRHGAVLMDIREGWIHYGVEYNRFELKDLPPDEHDLYVHPFYRQDMARLATELQLSSMSPGQAVNTVYRFFQDNFTYSLTQQQRYPKGKYLSNFLFRDRRGHCEYFATATALLLRSVGIPSRYAVGYAIDEFSSLEGQYIGRARHAHSWDLVYINNKWQVLDTTPSIWAPYEDEHASALEPLMDIWSWIAYTWSRWQADTPTDEKSYTDYLIWLLIPLIAVLAWRMYFKERIKYRKPGTGVIQQKHLPGDDSDFYQITKLIEVSGLPRHPGETLPAWLKRIGTRVQIHKLDAAMRLHYQYRFDPAGLTADDALQLQKHVSDLLASKQVWLPLSGRS